MIGLLSLFLFAADTSLEVDRCAGKQTGRLKRCFPYQKCQKIYQVYPLALIMALERSDSNLNKVYSHYSRETSTLIPMQLQIRNIYLVRKGIFYLTRDTS